MKKLFFILIILLISCHIKYKKPFIIIGKNPHHSLCSDGYCHYYYIDANGFKNDFCEKENLYNI